MVASLQMFRLAVCSQLRRRAFASSTAFYHSKVARSSSRAVSRQRPPSMTPGLWKTFPSTCVNLEKIHFVSFLGKDIIDMTNCIYMITMSDTWKYIDVVDGGTKLWQSVDSHLTNNLSPVYQHIHLMEGVAVTEVTVLDYGTEGDELRERMKLIVKGWNQDELINIEHNPFGSRSKLTQVYLIARGGKSLDIH